MSEGFPRRHPDTAFRKIGDDGGLVVLPGRAEVKVLNPVGIAVYALLDGTRDLDALSQAIAEQFDVEPDTARRDVEAFVDDLRQAGMIEEAA